MMEEFENIIAEYRIDENQLEDVQNEALGRGQYSEVVEATLRGRGRVAFKKLKSRELRREDPSFLAEEFRKQHQLNHDNILRAFGWIKMRNGIKNGKMDYTYGIILELAREGELENFILNNPFIEDLRIMRWALDAANGLEYMHNSPSIRLIHRDVKPENMVLDHNLTLKICDFGFAKELSSIVFSEIGTPIYMAPEIFQRRGYSEKCDVYSWALSFWRCFAREKPFQTAKKYEELIELKRNDYILTNLPNVSLDMNILLSECARVNSDGRPTMAQIVEFLTEKLGHQ